MWKPPHLCGRKSGIESRALALGIENKQLTNGMQLQVGFIAENENDGGRRFVFGLGFGAHFGFGLLV
jgi:hypothetical protein